MGFIANMARIAEECIHSLVLVGDILEMHLTPVAVTPPTKEEFLAAWKADTVVSSFASAVRKMADEDRVNVYYIRGDQDREITDEMVKQIFGDNVSILPFCLLFGIFLSAFLAIFLSASWSTFWLIFYLLFGYFLATF